MNSTAKHELVLILDFGGQYTQLIARRVRELHVFSEIIPFDTPLDRLTARNPKAIILSGGPASVYAASAPVCDTAVFEVGVPVLGICYGAQLMARLLGGSVEHAPAGEYGKTTVKLDETSSLFRGLPAETSCWMSHTDRIGTIPPGFRTIASTPACPIAAMENPDQRQSVSYTHLRAHETRHDLVCRLLLEKKKTT